MPDDVDLPPLPSDPASTSTRPSLPFLLTRKRTHNSIDDDVTTSSDPALFSSDEQAPDLEDYATGRHKKHRYRGSWWDHHQASSASSQRSRVSIKVKKRQFTRNYDSGIFMGSEASDEALSSDSFGLEEELLMDQRRAERRLETPPPRENDVDATPRAKIPVRAPATMSREDEAVCGIVRRCLDEGKESVDLSSMGLMTLPSEVASLQTLSKQADIVPGMLDIGSSFEPHLRLFLSNNLLSTLPSTIFDLRNLRELSVRNNHLTDLPASIRELTNLEILNVAGNMLTELPFEIVELIRFHNLRTIIATPNPFAALPVETSKYKLKYSSTRGTDALWLDRMEIAPSANPTLTTTREPAPSLSEVVLRQLARLDPDCTIDYAAYLHADTPDAVLAKLATLKLARSRRCTTCDRPIVLPGKEWIEWWRLAKRADPQGADGDVAAAAAGGQAGYFTAAEGYLPYRRVQCSERCDGSRNAWAGVGSKNHMGNSTASWSHSP